ncbi:MAG TPA: hypothetical protein VMV59_07210 [Candidatus Dormibacteraeota bacterium]|nr:hypothetical protein [Candidatus Dormibacteraeota bacterium]
MASTIPSGIARGDTFPAIEGMKFDEHGRIIWPPLPSQTAPPAPEETSTF